MPNQAVHYPLITENALVRSSLQKYAMTFSSNSCLKWGMKVCQKATYFCCINGELIHFVKPALYEEANQDCNLRKGYLSKSAFLRKIQLENFKSIQFKGTPPMEKIISYVGNQTVFWTDLHRGIIFNKTVLT